MPDISHTLLTTNLGGRCHYAHFPNEEDEV